MKQLIRRQRYPDKEMKFYQDLSNEYYNNFIIQKLIIK